MPTPEEQRIYHARIEEKDGIRVIDDGDTLVETVGPWHTHIGKPGEVLHSTKFFPPERVMVPEEMADHLVSGNAAVILARGKGKAKKALKELPEDKAVRPGEDKSGDADELLGD